MEIWRACRYGGRGHVGMEGVQACRLIIIIIIYYYLVYLPPDSALFRVHAGITVQMKEKPLARAEKTYAFHFCASLA